MHKKFVFSKFILLLLCVGINVLFFNFVRAQSSDSFSLEEGFFSEDIFLSHLNEGEIFLVEHEDLVMPPVENPVISPIVPPVSDAPFVPRADKGAGSDIIKKTFLKWSPTFSAAKDRVKKKKTEENFPEPSPEILNSKDYFSSVISPESDSSQKIDFPGLKKIPLIVRVFESEKFSLDSLLSLIRPTGSVGKKLSFEQPVSFLEVFQTLPDEEKEKVAQLFSAAGLSANLFNEAYLQDIDETKASSLLASYISISLYGKMDQRMQKMQNLIFFLILAIGALLLFQFRVFSPMLASPCRQSRVRCKKNSSLSGSFFVKSFHSILLFLLVSFLVGFFLQNDLFAASGTMRYQGRLKLPEGNYAEGNYVFRMSFWNTKKSEDSDFVSGNIQTSASAYKGWKEEIPVSIPAGGYFSLVLGKTNSIPSSLFHSQNGLFLQIEVRAASESLYRLIDTSSDPQENRREVLSIPFAKNTQQLDGRKAGLGANQVPYLNNQGLLPFGVLPAGTSQSFFTIDALNQSASNENLTLQFGEALAKTLSFNKNLQRFEFNDSVAVLGDLMISGTVNGANIGLRNETIVLSPQYPQSVFLSESSFNKGSMYESSEIVFGKTMNSLQWKSVQPVLHDYTTVISFAVPSGFRRFLNPALQFSFQTQDAVSHSKIDFFVERKNDPGEDLLQGSGLSLSSGDWTNRSFVFSDALFFVPGEVLVLKIRMYSKDSRVVKIGDLLIHYESQ